MSGVGGARSSDEQVQQVIEAARWSTQPGRVQKADLVVVQDASLQALIAANCTQPVDASPRATLLLVGRGAYESRIDEAFECGRLAERAVLAAAATGLTADVRTLTPQGRKLVKDALGIAHEKRLASVVMLHER